MGGLRVWKVLCGFLFGGETCYWLEAAVSLKGGRERVVVRLGREEK